MGRLGFIGMIALVVLGTGYFLWPYVAADLEDLETHKSGYVHYALSDGAGRAVSQDTFKDQHTLVVFGYTHCPDVCPTSLQDVAETLEQLQDDAARFVPVFITIDPARDHGADLHAYVQNFHSRFVGLSGSNEAIRSAAKSFRAFFQKEKPDAGDPESYLMSHTASVYVIGPNGKGPLKTFKYGETPERMAAALRDIPPIRSH